MKVVKAHFSLEEQNNVVYLNASHFEHPCCAHPLIAVANGNGLWVETKILLQVLVSIL